MNPATTPTRTIDLTKTHPARIAAKTLELFDAGELADNPTLLFPDRYRIHIKTQTREELYQEATAIGANVAGARLSQKNTPADKWEREYAAAANLLADTLQKYKVKETIEAAGFIPTGSCYDHGIQGEIVISERFVYAPFPLIRLSIHANTELGEPFPTAELRLLHGNLPSETSEATQGQNFIEMNVSCQNLADLKHLAGMLETFHKTNGETLRCNGGKPCQVPTLPDDRSRLITHTAPPTELS